MGNQDEQTVLKLYQCLPEAHRHTTDRYEVYNWLPRDRHEGRKGREANWNEGLHSVLRGKLNRLIRRTKGYSKKQEMLTGSLALLWLHQGWI